MAIKTRDAIAKTNEAIVVVFDTFIFQLVFLRVLLQEECRVEVSVTFRSTLCASGRNSRLQFVL